MAEILGIIYLIINEINGKCYIGKTIDFKRRMRDHRSAKSKTSLLHKSIRKYGWKNFTVIKLHEDVPMDDIEWLEKHCILIWNTMNPEGYNLRFGGNRGLPSEETKKRISKSVKEAFKPNQRYDIWNQSDDIITKYKDGSTIASISREYKCHRGIIKRILIENNIKIEPRKGIRREDIWSKSEEIIRKYIIGFSLTDLGNEYKCDPNIIQNILKKNNIPRREKSSHNERSREKIRKTSIGRKHSNKTRDLISRKTQDRFYYINTENFQKWRKSSGSSRKTLADLIGCTTKTIGNWEIGKGISPELYSKLSKFIKADPIEKFGEPSRKRN